jgi:hypothetical protein
MAFWATVVVVVVLAYPLSFGPACWISSRCECGPQFVTAIYRPVLLILARGPRGIQGFMHRYARLGAQADWELRYSPDDATFTWGYAITGRD